MDRRISQWQFRLTQEEKVAISSNFITLTYDNSKAKITRNGYLSLCKRDLQLFFKKLRKTNSEKIRYYACGEYGSKTFRPHYHIILFNARLDTIQPAWEYGHVHYGDVSGASIAYTIGYISKPRLVPVSQQDDREREFSVMSKGIGKSYLTPAAIRYHKSDVENRVCHVIEGGKKVSMPRYYKDKIFNDVERKRISIAGKAKQEKIDDDIRHLTPADYSQLEEKKAAQEAAIVNRKKQIKNGKI